MKHLTVIFFLFVWLSRDVAGQELFVSPSGHDAASGTCEQPLGTLAGARDRIRFWHRQHAVLDTVFVRIAPGVYPLVEPLTLTHEDSGTETAPIVYTALTDERPIICGGFELAPFEIVAPNLWRVFVPETRYGFRFEHLYVNGRRRFRAQTPNRGAFLRISRTEDCLLSEGGTKNMYGMSSDFAVQKIFLPPEDAYLLKDIEPDEQRDVILAFNHLWRHTRKPPAFINVVDSAWYISGKSIIWDYGINARSRYVVENYRRALDAPGEWFLDRDGWLWYIPLPGETPEQIRCVAPVAGKFLCISGEAIRPVQHVRFENLRFEVSGYLTPPEGCVDPQAAATLEAVVQVDHARHIDFLRCDVSQTGLHAFWFRENCSHCRLEHCHLYDLGGGGVKIGTHTVPPDALLTGHITVHNSIIHNGGHVFPPAPGVILFNAADCEVTHNEIADFRYSGVSVGWVWGYAHSPSKRNHIDFNHIHHLGWGELCDMGGVYTLGASEGTTVGNNHIHHVYSWKYGGWGLYTDEGSSGIVMENNLVYACKDAGFHQHYGRENIIRNNIFASNLIRAIQFSRPEEHLSYTFTNNIVYLDRGQAITFRKADDFTKANVHYDRNCYWDTRTREPEFYGRSFEAWKQLGRDTHAIVADPQFADPVRFDFRPSNRAALRRIGFKPFDPSQAGVYGSDEWKAKARMPAERERAYDEQVARMMQE
jgi:parallel beta-helix repeat protein